jgi:tRNA A-37 threonylcarbamoyl transferase component Bud32
MKGKPLGAILCNPPITFCAPDNVSGVGRRRLSLADKINVNECSTVENMHRFGSLSQNGIVYKVDNGIAKYIIKTTPLTNASENENHYVHIFSNMVRQEINEHFPICYSSLICGGVSYKNNPSLYRKFLDDMHEMNHPAVSDFLRIIMKTTPPDKWNTVERLIKWNKLAQMWKILSPNITEIHELKTPFLSRVFVMEMAEMDLRMFLQTKLGTVSMMKQICSTLQFIYETGFHHNDMHPGNVLLMDDMILLWDFEKMQQKNASIELYDLIYLCNSFANTNHWEPVVMEFINNVLDGKITTWDDVNNSSVSAVFLT